MKFTLPDRSLIDAAVREVRSGSNGSALTYSLNNYYGRGPVSRIKRARFQLALDLAAARPTERVIDMGTADGILLPSLSRYYKHVTALEVHPPAVELASALVRVAGLGNVQVVNSAGQTGDELRAAIGTGYGVMFLLETLEHVGEQPDMWGSKVAFVRYCFSLLEPDARIIVSVPKMVGPILFGKNLLQRALGLGHDPLTFRQLCRSAFLYDTDELEPLWNGHHVGFNHLKLDRHLAANFTVHRRKETVISVFYVLGPK